jgi:TPR repeat protein
MNPKISLRCAAALMLVAAVSASGQEVEDLEKLDRQEKTGLRYYDRGDYQAAFNDLSGTAVRGLKPSQYILAFMFLKGQYVDQSLLLGMAWLGVAKESQDPEWMELYQSIYQRLSPEQQAIVDAKVAQYVEQYGMATQNVSCSRQPVAGSRRMESNCIKIDGKTSPIFPVELKP